MVSIAILSLIMGLLVQITGQTSNIWRQTSSRAEQFRESRTAFEAMTRRISQATLNTYWDYDLVKDVGSAGSTGAAEYMPTGYIRQSELRFISGPMQSGATPLDTSKNEFRPGHGIFFQAPFGVVADVSPSDKTGTKFEGMNELLNTWGFYVEVRDDAAVRPQFVDSRNSRVRSRLMEMIEPSSAMNIYSKTSHSFRNSISEVLERRNYSGFDWFSISLNFSPNASGATGALTSRSHVLAENIVALAILPKLAEEDAANIDDGAGGSVNLKAEDRATALAPEYFYHSASIGAAGSAGVDALKGLLNSKHQLPPILQVTMVAVDEPSAIRMGVRNPDADPLGVGPETLFLTRAKDLEADLYLHNPTTGRGSDQSLEQRLLDQRVNYRIFSTNVHLRGAKWSREQTK